MCLLNHNPAEFALENGPYGISNYWGKKKKAQIQDLTKGGSDKRPAKAKKILGPLKCDLQRFQGQFEVV